MALTRARPIAGDASLCAELASEVAEILAMPRDRHKVLDDAAEMRRLLEAEKPARDPWDIKLIPGGLIDLEFIAQCAVLTGAADPLPSGATLEVLAGLRQDFAGPQERQELADAYSLYLHLTQMIRLCLTGPFERDDAPPGLVDLLLKTTDLPDFGVLEAHLTATATAVRRIFERLIQDGRGDTNKTAIGKERQ